MTPRTTPKPSAGPLPLVYVLSTGRSGSTLLDLLLGTHAELTTVGEFQLLPFVAADPAARCGCGELLRACDFWSPILATPALATPAHPIEALRERLDAGRLLRPRFLPALLSGLTSESVRAEARSYGGANATALDLVSRAAGGATLVDSSKDPYRLFLLARSGCFDLHVIHLVRDPRGVVCSFADGASPSPRRAAHLATRWAVQQVLFSRLVRTTIPRERTTVMRYEDLASNPAATLGALAARLGVEADGFAVDDFRAHPNHAIAGNPMRQRSDPVALDERWRGALDPGTADFVWRLTAPIARSYGYHR